MFNFGWLIVVPLISTVLAQKIAHNTESVRLLKVNETVLPSGSDLVFSWAKCVICDGYDAHLYLEDTSGVRSIPHQLKSAVTSLKITNLPPRTVYRLVVKRLPSDIYSSEVTGRTSSTEAPLPVENLVARPLTNTSMQIEWTARNADGFIARVFENGTAIQEKVIPDFSNHSIVNITNLKPETDYEVQVTAFYFPPAGNSISAVSSARVRTLPSILPELLLKWEFDSELKLFWNSPESPAPAKHRLRCSEGKLFDASFRGNVDFVSIENAADISQTDCLLETWYSIDERAKVTARITALGPLKNLGDRSKSEAVTCENHGHLGDIRAATYKLEKVNGMELLVVSFSGTYPSMLSLDEFQYKVCERDGSCENWRGTKEADYPTLLLQSANLKAWTPLIIQYRLELQCPTADPWDSFSRGGRYFEVARSVEIPAMIGPVDQVAEITATSSLVSWKYNRSSPSPAYFLVTYCTGSDCSSQSVPGDRRSVTLEALKGSSIYYVTIQAVQVRDDRAYVSPTGLTTVITPKLESSETATLTSTQTANSSTVQLHIAHNSSADLPPVVEYHIDICSRAVSIWNDAAFASLLIANKTCESEVSTNASFDLVRSPWTLYEVSVIVCYGAFDSEVPVNLTLPIYEEAPSPLAGLSWSPGESRLSWKYDSPIPSGFSISICPSREDAPDMCSDITAGPLDRQYHVVPSDLTENGFVVFVTPFVAYEGRVYNGTRSELTVKPLSSLNTPQR